MTLIGPAAVRTGLAGRPVLLVLRPLGLGDLLTAVPALRGLRRAYPGHRLVLAGPAGLGELAVAEGLADEAVEVRPHEVPPLQDVDIAVDLHGRGPRSHRALQALRPRRLLAFGNDLAAHDGPAWDEAEPEVARWCRMLVESGIPCDPADLRLRADPSSGRSRRAVVHPGAAAPGRRWPAERFAAVVDGLAARGLAVEVTAGPGEEPLARAVAGRHGAVATYGLRALADVLQDARLLVVGDTGVGHLGTACGTPSVRLFGPVDPARWGPTIDPGRHRVLWHGTGDGDPHAARLDPALAAITPAEVLAAADDLAAADLAAADDLASVDQAAPQSSPTR